MLRLRNKFEIEPLMPTMTLRTMKTTHTKRIYRDETLRHQSARMPLTQWRRGVKRREEARHRRIGWHDVVQHMSWADITAGSRRVVDAVGHL